MLKGFRHPAINVRAPRYFVACASCACDRCTREMIAVGLALGAGHRMRVDDGEPDRVGAVARAWRTVQAPAWVFDVAYLPRRVRGRLQRLSPGYRFALHPATGGHRWLNHCPHCGGVQDDDYLHGEPDVAFMPFTVDAAQRIALHAVDAPFAAAIGGTSDDPPLFGAMRRIDRSIR